MTHDAKLTPAQARISTAWPQCTFHVIKIANYRQSKVAFAAARKLGLTAVWTGPLMVIWPKQDNQLTTMVYACAARMLLALHYHERTWSDHEKDTRRRFLKRWCPAALPAFDLIRHKMYV